MGKHPKFFNALWDAGGEIFEVGGSVRDRFMGHPHKDQDLLVARLPMEPMKKVLKPYGKMATVGRVFGVLKFIPFEHPSQTFDIAIPRKEISTGIGHRDFKVEYDPHLPIEEDLRRRDFTINAIALDLKTEKHIDPFDGEKDLKKKLLRMVFEDSFHEDPLRLVRAVQFAARFHLTIEPETLESMQKNAPLIKTVSHERVIEEVRKLMTAPKPSEGFDWMRKTGLLPLVFPEVAETIDVGQDKKPGDDVYGHTMRVLDAARGDPYVENRGDMELMFAALFHDVGKTPTRSYDKEKDRIVFYGHQMASRRMCRKWLKRMKASVIGLNHNHVEKLILNHMFETKSYFTEKAVRRFIRKISPELIFKLLDLRLADNRGGKYPKSINGVLKMRARVRSELSKKPPFSAKDLEINGHDLMQAGIPAGPHMGKILKQLVELVLDDPKLNTKDQLLAIVKDMLENQSDGKEKETSL